MSKEESKAPTEIKPPYGNVTWYEQFFELIRTKSFDKFDKEIIELNIVKRANATMLFNALRFLGLVEKDGKVTDKFESLRRKGEEFKQNLKTVVNEAYSHLFSKVVVSKAKPENLYNYFAEYYGYGEATASLSTKIFVYLCKKAEIELSQELIKGEFRAKKGKRKRKSKEKIEGKEIKERISKTPKDVHEIKWQDDILIRLKKGNRKTRQKMARIAKKLIDMYVEEEEEEETE